MTDHVLLEPSHSARLPYFPVPPRLAFFCAMARMPHAYRPLLIFMVSGLFLALAEEACDSDVHVSASQAMLQTQSMREHVVLEAREVKLRNLSDFSSLNQSNGSAIIAMVDATCWWFN